MRHYMLMAAILAAIAVPATCANAQNFHAKFSGFNELGALNAETGAILSKGQATIALKLNKQLKTLNYTLTYSNLEAPITQAHIHFGKVHVPGGIFLFLCSNLGNGPAGTPLCPPSGTVSGMLTGGSVLAVPGQNITAGDFDAVTDILLSNSAYANIHTQRFPAGEIRGQIRRDDDQGDDEQ
jgi:CHRD domain-containing protein